MEEKRTLQEAAIDNLQQVYSIFVVIKNKIVSGNINEIATGIAFLELFSYEIKDSGSLSLSRVVEKRNEILRTWQEIQ